MATLTHKREAFCQYYAAHRNGAGAYRHAFNVRSDTADQTCANNGAKLLADTDIMGRIEELIADMGKAAVTTPGAPAFDAVRALASWLDIATANPDELIGLRVGNCRYCRGDNHEYQWIEGEFIEQLNRAEFALRSGANVMLPDVGGGFGFDHTLAPLDDCPRCRGEGLERVVARDTSKLSPQAKMLYGGLKKKKDGLEIVIASREKALENATRIIGAFKDNVRLDASISGMVAAVHAAATGTDPAQVAKMYQDVMRGIAN